MTIDFSEKLNCFERYQTVGSVLKYGTKKTGPVDVSFVIPTYKRPVYLKETLDSVFAQRPSRLTYEVLVVDNEQVELEGSEKEKLLRQYEPSRMAYYQNEKNIGMFANWNRCVELAQGTWVSMIHDDDLVDEDYLLKLESFYDRITNAGDVAYVKTAYELFGGKYNGKSSIRKRKKGDPLIPYRKIEIELLTSYSAGAPSSGTLINKKLFLQSGGFREELIPSGDSFFPMHLVLDYGFKTYVTRNMMGSRRIEVNASFDKEMILRHGEICKTFFKDYYPTIGRISKTVYTCFKNEIYYGLYLAEKLSIEGSSTIKEEDKENLIRTAYENLERPAFRRACWFLFRAMQKACRTLKGL